MLKYQNKYYEIYGKLVMY